MSDMLEITTAQARVLRSIAYYEEESKEKGGTQYTSSQKVSNEIHVSGSTFNDNIKKLHENLMVVRLDWEGKTKPYTITEMGQIAWLRHFPIKDNVLLFYKKFPNIKTYDIEKTIYEIRHPYKSIINQKVIDIILKYTLDNFQIRELTNTKYVKLILEERINLPSHYGLIQTSYKRYYSIAEPALGKKILKKMNKVSKGFYEIYDEIEIKITERITFLFYYNLFYFMSTPLAMFEIIGECVYPELEIDDEDDFQEVQLRTFELSTEICKKLKNVRKKITTDKNIKHIIEINLKQLAKYENSDFQQFSKLFK